jgi:hypothetical protein
MTDLIPPPVLDIREEASFAAQAVGYISGGLTVDRIDQQIEELQKLRVAVQGGLPLPICPELTNANNSSPHTVFLEAQAWLLAQMAFRINQLPKRDQIEFANLFKIGLREAEPATTTLRFDVSPPLNQDVTIPFGTLISTQNEDFVFETTAVLVIPYGTPNATVLAKRTVTGKTTLSANVLIKQLDSIAWVENVTNPAAVNSGGDEETIEEALLRARNYQRRAERLVSTQDIEDAIFEEALRGNGIVKAFPFVRSGDFASDLPGHTTVLVMTDAGEPVSVEVRYTINTLLEQLVGNQFVYVLDPIYVNFNVVAQVKLNSGATQTAVLQAVERNLREVYRAKKENFGRAIVRSEVIAAIEGTTGVDRIEALANGQIITSPAEDVQLRPWQLPKLVNVTLTVI